MKSKPIFILHNSASCSLWETNQVLKPGSIMITSYSNSSLAIRIVSFCLLIAYADFETTGLRLVQLMIAK
jgi:hypothetical protein